MAEGRKVVVKLTVTIVLFLGSINGSVGLELQVEPLSAVQLCHNPLQLGLCGTRAHTEEHAGEM